MSELAAGGSWADDEDSVAAELNSNSLARAARQASTSDIQEKTTTQSGDAKPSISAASSVTSPDAAHSSGPPSRDDDTSSVPNASSESTWDSKSQSSEPAAKSADSADSKGNSEASEETAKETAPPKPRYQPAPPPAVNIWQQRAQLLSAKTPARPVAAVSESARSQPERKLTKGEKKAAAAARENGATGQVQAQDSKPVVNGARNRDPRQTQRGDAETTTDNQRRMVPHRQSLAGNTHAPPSATNEVAWPTVETARQEELKKAQETEEKVEKDQTTTPGSKPHGKTEWTKIAFVPTAVFDTALPTRGGARGGRGGARGGFSSRGGANGLASAERSGRASSLPNGDQPDAAKTDREAMLPPPTKFGRVAGEQNAAEQAQDGTAVNGHASNGDAALVNGSLHDGEPGAQTNGMAPHKRHPSTTRRNKSPRKSDGLKGANERRSSVVGQTDGERYPLPHTAYCMSGCAVLLTYNNRCIRPGHV